MEALLLASMLTCSEGNWFLEGLMKAQGLSLSERVEIFMEIRNSMPDECELAEEYTRP